MLKLQAHVLPLVPDEVGVPADPAVCRIRVGLRETRAPPCFVSKACVDLLRLYSAKPPIRDSQEGRCGALTSDKILEHSRQVQPLLIFSEAHSG